MGPDTLVASAARRLRALPTIAVQTASWGFAALLSPLLALNAIDFRRGVAANPFYRSMITRLVADHPWFYDASVFMWNFPQYSGIYAPVPPLMGRVLHIGCGTGLMNRFWSCRRKALDTTFVNLDRSGAYLRHRRTRRGCWSVRADAYAVPLAEGSCDAVVFARCFHHLRHHRRALAEAQRVLRNGGVVVVVDPVSRAPRDFPARMANTPLDGLVWLYTVSALEARVRESLPSGLDLQSVTTVRQLNVTNWNPWWPHEDAVIILKRSEAPVRVIDNARMDVGVGDR